MRTYAADRADPARETARLSRARPAANHQRSEPGRDALSSLSRALGPGTIALQAKLTIGTPGDAHEQQADRVAAQIVGMSETLVAAAKSQSGGAMPGLLQAKNESAPSPVAAPQIVHDVVASPGRPLDPATRAFMEPRFGLDFQHVRVHADARAATSAAAIDARAYTVGSNIAFGAGEYAPGTDAGRLLLSHELAHVVQQQSGLVRRLPILNAGTGTTAELKAELKRLENEYMAASIAFREEAGDKVPAPSDFLQYPALIEKLRKRIAERGWPKVGDCGLSLSFDGSKLSISGSRNKTIPAVSGKPIAGKFDQSKERQKIEKTGPIPEGKYWINPSELKSLWYYPSQWLPGALDALTYGTYGRAVATIWAPDAWGVARITIHPYDDTHTFGRGGFFIHGGSTPGSAGCIDLTGKMSEFVAVLEDFATCTIPLTVAYPDADKTEK